MDEDVGHFEHILSMQREGGEQFCAAPLQRSTELVRSPLFSAGKFRFDSSDEWEGSVCDALLVGDLKTVVEGYLRKGRMADALVVASMGGTALWNQTQEMYFRQNNRQGVVRADAGRIRSALLGLG